jgi:hypothetical protein
MTEDERVDCLIMLDKYMDAVVQALCTTRRWTKKRPTMALRQLGKAVFFLEMAEEKFKALCGKRDVLRVGQYLPPFEAPDGTIYAGSRVVSVTDERDSDDA